MDEADFWKIAGSELGLLLGHWPLMLMLLVVWLGMAGKLARGAGFHRFFRDDPTTLARAGRRWIWVSAAFWSQFGLAALAGTVWIGMHSNHLWTCGADGLRASCGFYPWGDATPRVLWSIVAACAVASAIGLLASRYELSRPLANRSEDDKSDLEYLEPEVIRRELMGGAAGAAGGTQALLVVLSVALAGQARGFGALLAFALIAAGVLLVVNRTRKFLACLSVLGFFIGLVLILTVATAALSLIVGVRDGWGVALVLGALAGAWVANGRAFKYRIPGFPPTSYAAPVVDPDAAAPKLPGHPAPVDPLDALKAWHARATAAAPGRKPILVVFATSGGAYRATFWTALLLDKLLRHDRPGDDFPGLGSGIRLVTGASGGMVAGAYFAAMRAAPDIGEASLCARIEGDIRRYQEGPEGGRRRVPVPRDSLTAVLQQTLRHDVPRILWPTSGVDRGVVLESQWATLGVTFAGLRASEAAGAAPGLILSPMLVESGAPAFFSNLDLGDLRVDGKDRPDGQGPANRDSVEVFDAFPEAWLHDASGTSVCPKHDEAFAEALRAGRGMTLATAVRLNATFPYISPAISLPTAPALRRVVDAGYYDNYGIDIAAAYLNAGRIRDWIVEHCAGVAILQARAFPSDPPTPPARRLARALHFLTSPPEALFKARASSQLFRNDEQVRLVRRSYAERAGEGFLESFIFEAPVEASMSWVLTDDEIAAMESILEKFETAKVPAARAEGKAMALSERRAAYATRKQKELTQAYTELKAFWAARSAPAGRLGAGGGRAGAPLAHSAMPPFALMYSTTWSRASASRSPAKAMEVPGTFSRGFSR